MSAARCACGAAVKILIEEIKIDLHRRDKYERTALMLAAKEGHSEIIQLLLEKDRVQIDHRDSHNRTALMFAH